MEAEIRKLIDGYIEAFENQDWGMMRRLCSEDFVFSGRTGHIELERMIEFRQARQSDLTITPSNLRIGISSDGEVA